MDTTDVAEHRDEEAVELRREAAAEVRRDKEEDSRDPAVVA